ncbi:hypothetical protein SDC9_123547 [bioreactor metagenome]|uniref:Uncharacterized protein n=1 Tax=bioreactor metagenome TaxID=1076179 RepID=A0A645CI04_9ZZZZ
MNLDLVFEPFWDYRIIKCEYDSLNSIATLFIQNPESYVNHEIRFSHVSLYLFLQNWDNKFLYDSFNELSSISFGREFIESKNIKQKWLKQYSLDFNVVIEIIRSTLLIKAETVDVDGIRYNLEEL